MVKKILLGLLTLFILSCSLFNEPLDPELIHRKKDKTPPLFSILSPTSDTLFEESVTLSGKVDKEDGKLSKVVWSVSDNLTELTNGTINKDGIAKDGAFSFNFSTVGFSSDIVIKVTVVDWNKNQSSQEIKLRYSGTFIPSFKVEAGNQKVNLYWNEIEGVENYNIYYTDNGGVPSESYHTVSNRYINAPTEESPLTINNLENGKLYRFLIKATHNNGTSLYSMVLDSVPQSTKTFVPTLVSEGDTVKLTWFSNSDRLKYNVLRSDQEEGQYSNISGEISANEYIDDNVYNYNTYYYKVIPVLDGTIPSETIGINHFNINFNDFNTLLDYDLPGNTRDIEVVGDRAYIAAGSGGFQIFDLSTKKLIKTLTLSGPPRSFEIKGNFAFITLGTNGLDIVQISGSSSESLPKLISNFKEPGIPYMDIAYHNSSYILITSYAKGLRVLDISDKANVAVIGEYSDIDSPKTYYYTTVESDGTYGYISLYSEDEDIELRRISLIDPANPTYNPNDNYVVSSGDKKMNPQVAKVSGDYLITGGSNNFTIFHKENGITPGTYTSTLQDKVGNINQVSIKDMLAYVMEDYYTLRRIRFNITGEIESVKSKNLTEKYDSLSHYNDSVILGKNSGGIQILKSSSLGDIKTTPYNFDSIIEIYSYGDKLYIQESYKLTEFTLSNGDLNISRTFNLPEIINEDFGNNSRVYNDSVYYTSERDLFIFDNNKSNKINMNIGDFKKIFGRSGDQLFVQRGLVDCYIIDISDPTNIDSFISLPYDGNFIRAEKKANFLFTVNGTKSLNVFNLEKKNKPIKITTAQLTNTPSSLSIAGDIAAIGQEYGKIEFFNISNPSIPQKIGEDVTGDISIPENKVIVKSLGSEYFVAVNIVNYNLDIYDVSEGTPYKIIEYPAIPGIEDNYTILGNKIYYIDKDDNRLKYIEIELD